MGDQIDNIVKVTITRQTSVPSMASFSEHMVVGEFDDSDIPTGFSKDNRVMTFTRNEISSALPEGSFVRRAAQAQFSQSPHIRRIYIGLKLKDESWKTALDAIAKENNEWYALTVSTRFMPEQQDVSGWVGMHTKLCILATSDPNTVDAETGDIGAWARLNNHDRTAVFYHPDVGDANTEPDPVPEAAYFGYMLTKHPGSATWALKSLSAVPTYELASEQAGRAFAKNVTTYMRTAGVPITSDGRVASGEFIDVIHGIDWLSARIQNLVFTPMIQMDKIPFTDEGVQVIVSQVRAALDEGVRRELLASYDISYPAVANVADNFKGERTLPDVNFTAVLAGAIHRTVIDGTVTL
jgi:hypothetical protein